LARPVSIFHIGPGLLVAQIDEHGIGEPRAWRVARGHAVAVKPAERRIEALDQLSVGVAHQRTLPAPVLAILAWLRERPAGPFSADGLTDAERVPVAVTEPGPSLAQWPEASSRRERRPACRLAPFLIVVTSDRAKDSTHRSMAPAIVSSPGHDPDFRDTVRGSP
jgi:hypothetical protein